MCLFLYISHSFSFSILYLSNIGHYDVCICRRDFFLPLMSSSSFLHPFVCSLHPSGYNSLTQANTRTRIKLIREKNILDRNKERKKEREREIEKLITHCICMRPMQMRAREWTSNILLHLNSPLSVHMSDRERENRRRSTPHMHPHRIEHGLHKVTGRINGIL